MNAHLLSSGRRASFLLAALFALSGIAALQQSLMERPEAVTAIILRSSTSSLHSSSASSVRSGSRVSSRSSVKSRSSASLHYAAPVLSKRRRGTGAVIIKPTPYTPPVAIKAGCGDGLVTGTETCDDRNVLSGDGCSGSCKVEDGFNCFAQPSKCSSVCGDGSVASNEKCDDGNLENGDGCSASCKLEFGYNCKGSPSVCAVPAYCGNGVVETGETCDDGNTRPSDGCYNCKTE